jgi:hypothetical protein
VANKITVLLDLVTDKAQSAAKGFKSSIAEAEGAANKFKAGASSAFATVQANAGALALGAGAAITTFGVKSVAAFQETALAAGKLSDATGLTVEDASRLQEVAGDLGVSTDSLAGSLVRMQKAVASNSDAVQELGIETQRTADGQVDVNATFLETVRKLGTVEDANEKALLASQLFGKGFADSAELILGSADDIQKRLDEVSGAQVITPEQVERARKFRDQMDDLSDSLKQVELTVGDQLVPVIGDLAEALVQVQSAAGKAKSAIEQIPGGSDLLGALGTNLFELPGKAKGEWDDLGRAIGILPDKVAPVRAEIDRMADSVNDGADAVNNLADEVVDLGQRWASATIPLEGASGAFAEMSSHADELARSTRETGDAADDAADDWNVFEDGLRKTVNTTTQLDEAINGLRDTIDLGSELDDISQGFADIEEARKDLVDGGDEAARRFRDQVRQQQGNLLDLLETFKDIPAEKRTRIVAEIAAGDLDSLNQALDDIVGKDRFVHVGLIMPNVQQAFSGVNVQVAPNAIPSTNLLNLNPAPSGAVDNSQTTIIYPVGTTPTSVTIDQRLYQSRNGSQPR